MKFAFQMIVTQWYYIEMFHVKTHWIVVSSAIRHNGLPVENALLKTRGGFEKEATPLVIPLFWQ
jgi:hypothetical protein